MAKYEVRYHATNPSFYGPIGASGWLRTHRPIAGLAWTMNIATAMDIGTTGGEGFVVRYPHTTNGNIVPVRDAPVYRYGEDFARDTAPW